jgi:predicted DNA-binding transcriptional regulator AlpA
MTADEQYVGVPEVAAKYGIGKDTVYRWARTGYVPALEAGRPDAKRKTWRFLLSEVEAALKAKQHPVDPWAMPPASRRARRVA